MHLLEEFEKRNISHEFQFLCKKTHIILLYIYIYIYNEFNFIYGVMVFIDDVIMQMFWLFLRTNKGFFWMIFCQKVIKNTHAKIMKEK